MKASASTHAPGGVRPPRPASMHLGCPRCGMSYLLPILRAGNPGAGRVFTCRECGFEVRFHSSDPDPGRPVERCSLCGNDEFFAQKDFNRRLGLSVVILSAALAFLVMLIDHRLGIAVLALVTAADWIIFSRLREVSVCYLCQTIYRGFPPGERHKPFYLGNEERFKQLRKLWLEGCDKSAERKVVS